MPGALQKEIKQSKPFKDPNVEAYLNLVKTTDVLTQAISALLKPHGLSEPLYNVLRILRGAEPDGLACREIGDRMVTRDPDITRLLDRLEGRGLAERGRESKDRRVVVTRITKAGKDLLKDLQAPLDAMLDRKLGHLGDDKLRTLIELLELARAS